MSSSFHRIICTQSRLSLALLVPTSVNPQITNLIYHPIDDAKEVLDLRLASKFFNRVSKLSQHTIPGGAPLGKDPPQR